MPRPRTASQDLLVYALPEEVVASGVDFSRSEYDSSPVVRTLYACFSVWPFIRYGILLACRFRLLICGVGSICVYRYTYGSAIRCLALPRSFAT